MSSSVSISRTDGVIRVTLVGRAGVDLAGELRTKLSEIGPTESISIDWGKAEHVEASVLQVLLSLQRSGGRSLCVRGDNEKVRQYLKLSGLSESFPVIGDAAIADSGALHG